MSTDIIEVSSNLTFANKFGSFKARLGINRMNYKIKPGLYSIGKPDSNSPVLVTANYKMTFDVLRSNLSDISAWILVLDTKGINVWCAAGKGTFGTKELLRRISKVKLSDIVSHKTIILPQLGASGISAYEVRAKSGFKITYGPVRSEDIKQFLNSGNKATKEMRTVRFTFKDRLVLIPMELTATLKPSLIIFGIMFLFNIIRPGSFGTPDLYAYLGAVFAGCLMVPAFLPFIPVKAFAAKGFIIGVIWLISFFTLYGWSFTLLKSLGYILTLPAISSFLGMNFTGASTYTSLSGVIKEMNIALPAIIISLFSGIILLIIS